MKERENIMENFLDRLVLLYGSENVEKIKNLKIAVFGAGGVGGFAIEALARSGVGEMHIFDNDTVAVSNLNRQIIAVRDTVGKYKAEVACERIKSINSDCKAVPHIVFYTTENAEDFNLGQYDWCVDAIDSVSGKISLAVECKKHGVKLISAMGAGNKTHPEMLEIADIYDTSVCPLARVMRHELRKRDIEKLTVVYSKEKPIEHETAVGEKPCPASNAFVPSTAGLLIASHIINSTVGMV